jgi:hypothetical protein
VFGYPAAQRSLSGTVHAHVRRASNVRAVGMTLSDALLNPVRERMQTTDVRATAQNAVNQGKSFLGKQVDERSTVIGQQIGELAQDLRAAGDHLRENGAVGAAAGYVDQGAELIERLAQYLQDADSDRLIGDLEQVARQQPWAIAGAALVLGFTASRFLKTSSVRRYTSAYGDGQYAS